ASLTLDPPYARRWIAAAGRSPACPDRQRHRAAAGGGRKMILNVVRSSRRVGRASARPTPARPGASLTLDPPFPRSVRRAFSLLEVIVAMAIFLMSIVAIGKLVSMGGERALDIEQQGEATMLAQSKLAEVVASALPLTSQSDQSFDEAPDYRWSL